MEFEVLPRIDETELDSLLVAAQKSGSCNNPRLGELIRIITRKALYTQENISCTDDWKLDLIAAAHLACCQAVEHYETDKCISPFNYMYTVARNAFRRERRKLKVRDTMIISDGIIVDESFYARNKRRFLEQAHINVTVNDEREIIKEVLHRKAPNIRRVVEKKAKEFDEVLNGENIIELVKIAKEQRESFENE